MNKVILYAGLLTVALAASYFTWTSEDTGADTGGAIVVRADPEDLHKLEWLAPKLTVAIEKRSDAAGDYAWVTVVETKERPKPKPAPEPEPEPEEAPDGATPDAPAPEAPPEEEPEMISETTTKAFRGNAAADDLWSSFAPLMALRELPAASGTDETFGFDEPSGTVKITRASGAVDVVLGGETYGSRDRYAKLDDRIYLLDDATVRPLQFAASRLVERRLHPLSANDLEQVEVRNSGGQTATFVRQNKDDPAKAYWSRQGDEGNKDDMGETWLGKLGRLKVTEYVPDAEAPALDLLVAVRMTDGTDTWGFELHKQVGGTDYFVKSDYARSLVQVTASLGEEISADLADLFAE